MCPWARRFVDEIEQIMCNIFLQGDKCMVVFVTNQNSDYCGGKWI